MREVRVKVLESAEDIGRLKRGDVIIAEIGVEGPFYATCVEESGEQIRLLTRDLSGNRRSFLELIFNPYGYDVHVGRLGGLKKIRGSEVGTKLHCPSGSRGEIYEEMGELAEYAGLISPQEVQR